MIDSVPAGSLYSYLKQKPVIKGIPAILSGVKMAQTKPEKLSLRDFLDPDHRVIDIAATPVFSVRSTDTVGSALEANVWGARRVMVRDRHGNFLGMVGSNG